MNPQNEVFVSFVHGYHKAEDADNSRAVPTLWALTAQGEQVYDYHFPFNSADFRSLPYPLVGEAPVGDHELADRHRFGFTGLERVGDSLFAGSWNGIYELDLHTRQVRRFISNRYTCYLHGIYVDEEHIIVAMPLKDMVEIMGREGRNLDRFCIDLSLKVVRNHDDAAIDYRFLRKPWSGTAGFFHLNHVQKIDGQIVLTSRNLGALLVVDPKRDTCRLRTVNYHTTNCVHDGDYVDGRFFFTSIDGKVIVASEPPEHDQEVFNYDLQTECFRPGEIERTWCRGIAVTPENVYITIDGRYGAGPFFSLLELDRQCNIVDQRRFDWSRVGADEKIRFVTGFDIVTV